LKKRQDKIQRFPLSPWAKAGMAIKDLEHEAREEDHDHSKPHRDQHYLLMLATHGRFQFNIDFQEVTLTAPALLLVFPGQVHHTIAMQEPKGWAVSFDPSQMDHELQLLMERGFKNPVTLDQQENFYHHAITLMDLIAQLQSGGLSGHGIKAMHSLLDALLGLIAGQLTLQFPTGGSNKINRAGVIGQAFNQLLKQHYKTWKQPAQYAGELHISAAHLYDTVKGITGSSVSALIQQYAILEAKRLLYFTDLSVKEIGYETGYNEPVYFGKLFKKITGLTPLQFRQQYRD
jgi:AraC family transcriptional activator of pobA